MEGRGLAGKAACSPNTMLPAAVMGRWKPCPIGLLCNQIVLPGNWIIVCKIYSSPNAE